MGSVQIERGDFFSLDLKSGRGFGHEIHGDRFAIVVQCDELNTQRQDGIFVVVPTTGQLRYRYLPDSVFVPSIASGLPDCVARVRQIFGADRRRLERFIGKVPADVMTEIDEKIRYVLNV